MQRARMSAVRGTRAELMRRGVSRLHPEIELSSSLPHSNQLASEQFFPRNASLSEFSIDWEERDQGAMPCQVPIEERKHQKSCSTTGIISHRNHLLLCDEAERVATAFLYSPDSDRSLDSISNINKNACVVGETTAKGGDKSVESDEHESQQVNYAGSQKSDASETETSQLEQMIEEVGRDGEDLREKENPVSRNEAADPLLLAFSVSPDNSSSIRKTRCSGSRSSSNASLNLSSASCKRPRLEISHPQRHALVPCRGLSAHHSPSRT